MFADLTLTSFQMASQAAGSKRHNDTHLEKEEESDCKRLRDDEGKAVSNPETQQQKQMYYVLTFVDQDAEQQQKPRVFRHEADAANAYIATCVDHYFSFYTEQDYDEGDYVILCWDEGMQRAHGDRATWSTLLTTIDAHAQARAAKKKVNTQDLCSNLRALSFSFKDAEGAVSWLSDDAYIHVDHVVLE